MVNDYLNYHTIQLDVLKFYKDKGAFDFLRYLCLRKNSKKWDLRTNWQNEWQLSENEEVSIEEPDRQLTIAKWFL